MEEGENIVKVVEVLGVFALKLTIEEKSNYKKKVIIKAFINTTLELSLREKKKLNHLSDFKRSTSGFPDRCLCDEAPVP